MINWVEKVYLVTYDPANDTDDGIKVFTSLKDAEKFAADITKTLKGIADIDTLDVSHGRRAQFYSSYDKGKEVEHGFY